MDDDTPTTAGSGCNIIGLSILMFGVLTIIPKSGFNSAESPERVDVRGMRSRMEYTPQSRAMRPGQEDIPRSATFGDLILAFFCIALAIVASALFIYGCSKALVGLIRGW